MWKRNKLKETGTDFFFTKEFFNTSSIGDKHRLKSEIEDISWVLIEETLKSQGKEDKLKEVEKFKKSNVKPFFLWKLHFADVFREKGGFDVVIGNPPYVGESGNKDIFRPIAQGNLGKFYQGKMDLFYFFLHLALELVRKNGKCAFITTNYFLTAFGAKKLRIDLKERSVIRNLINFNELKIFESALGQHNMISIFDKGQNFEKVATNALQRSWYYWMKKY